VEQMNHKDRGVEGKAMRQIHEEHLDLFGRLLKKSKKLRTYQMRFVRVLENAIFYSKKFESLMDKKWLMDQEGLSKQAVAQGEILVRNSEKDVAIIPMEAITRAFVDPEQRHKFSLEAKLGDNCEVYNMRIPDHDDLWIDKPSTTEDGKRIPSSETSAIWVDGILECRRMFLAKKRAAAKKLRRAPLNACPSERATTKAQTNLQKALAQSSTDVGKEVKSRMRSRRSGSICMDIIRIAGNGDEMTTKMRELEQMASYVPRILLGQYLTADMDSLAVLNTKDKKQETKRGIVRPLSFPLPSSCIVLADVSGFTNLNEAFSTVEGGAEKVTYHLNQYFTILLNIIEKHGGDCIKFAGDALIVLFKEEDEYDQQTYISRVHKHIKPIKSHQYTCLRAVRCALELGAQPAYKITGVRGFHKVELTLHVAIGYGDLQALHVGGHNGEWEFLLAGAPFRQIAKAIDLSKKGEVVVTKEVWAEIKKHCIGKPVSAYSSSEVKVTRVIHDVKVVPAASITIPKQMRPAIRRYVPRMVRDGIGRGMTRWLAELRAVSVIFVNLKGLLLNRKNNASLEKTHEVLGCMQSVVACNQGYLRQFLVDDKGTVLIAVFGVPPFSWEDNGYRAVKTAMELSQTLHALDVTHAIGIASGMVYVGSVGSLSRREHAVVGDTVNSAARLSCKAPVGTVWVDENTYKQAERKITMAQCGSIKVKGKNKKIQIFKPTGFRVARNLLEGPHVIGRDEILKKCMNELVAVKVDRLKRMIWLIGPAGVGKTVVMGYVYRVAKQNLPTFYIIGDATATRLAHNVWGGLLEQVMGLSGMAPAMVRDCIIQAVDKSEELQTLAPYLELLNTLLDCEFPATVESGKLLNEGFMPDAMQAISLFTHNILLELVKISVGNRPSVWVIDDAHNIDQESIRLLLDVFDALPSALMIMATREIKIRTNHLGSPDPKQSGVKDLLSNQIPIEEGDEEAAAALAEAEDSVAVTSSGLASRDSKARLNTVLKAVQGRSKLVHDNEKELKKLVSEIQTPPNTPYKKEVGTTKYPLKVSASKKTEKHSKSVSPSSRSSNKSALKGYRGELKNVRGKLEGTKGNKGLSLWRERERNDTETQISAVSAPCLLEEPQGGKKRRSPSNHTRPSLRNNSRKENFNGDNSSDKDLKDLEASSSHKKTGSDPLPSIHSPGHEFHRGEKWLCRGTDRIEREDETNRHDTKKLEMVAAGASSETLPETKSRELPVVQDKQDSSRESIVARSLSFNHDDLKPPGISFLNIPQSISGQRSRTGSEGNEKGGGAEGRRGIQGQNNGAERGGAATMVAAFKEGWRRIFNRRGDISSPSLPHSKRITGSRTPRPSQSLSPSRRYYFEKDIKSSVANNLGVFGPDEMEPSLVEALARHLKQRDALKLEIKGLEPPDMHRMLRQQLNVTEIPERVLQFIVHRAHSNPFVASEILSALRSKGVVKVQAGAVKFDEREDLEKLQLPRSIKDLITMRLDNLPNHELLVCKLASIFGITVPRGGLEFVWTREGYPAEKLWPALISLEHRGIMHQSSSSEYTFSQPLVAEACIDTILYERRARIHLIISKYYVFRMKAEQDHIDAQKHRNQVSPLSSRVRRRSISVEWSSKLNRNITSPTESNGEKVESEERIRTKAQVEQKSSTTQQHTPSDQREKASCSNNPLLAGSQATNTKKIKKHRRGMTLESMASLELSDQSLQTSKPSLNDYRAPHMFMQTMPIGSDIKRGKEEDEDGKRGLIGASISDMSASNINLNREPGWRPTLQRLKSIEARERSSLDCDAVKQKVGDHYVSACLISGRCPDSAAKAALEHLNEMWQLRRNMRSRGQAALLVQKAFKIQSLYMVESAMDLELFVKHKKIFETVLKGSDAVKRNVELAEKDLEAADKAWKEAIIAGNRKKATQIVNQSLNVYKKFRSQGIKSNKVEKLEMMQKNRKLLAMFFQE